MGSPSKKSKAEIAAHRQRGRERFRVLEAQEFGNLKMLQYQSKENTDTGSFYELALKEDNDHNQFIVRRGISNYQPSASGIPEPTCSEIPVPALDSGPVSGSGSESTGPAPAPATDTVPPQPEPSPKSKKQPRQSNQAKSTPSPKKPRTEPSSNGASTIALRTRRAVRNTRAKGKCPAVEQLSTGINSMGIKEEEDDSDNETVVTNHILH